MDLFYYSVAIWQNLLFFLQALLFYPELIPSFVTSLVLIVNKCKYVWIGCTDWLILQLWEEQIKQLKTLNSRFQRQNSCKSYHEQEAWSKWSRNECPFSEAPKVFQSKQRYQSPATNRGESTGKIYLWELPELLWASIQDKRSGLHSWFLKCVTVIFIEVDDIKAKTVIHDLNWCHPSCSKGKVYWMSAATRATWALFLVCKTSSTRGMHTTGWRVYKHSHALQTRRDCCRRYRWKSYWQGEETTEIGLLVTRPRRQRADVERGYAIPLLPAFNDPHVRICSHERAADIRELRVSIQCQVQVGWFHGAGRRTRAIRHCVGVSQIFGDRYVHMWDHDNIRFT